MNFSTREGSSEGVNYPNKRISKTRLRSLEVDEVHDTFKVEVPDTFKVEVPDIFKVEVHDIIFNNDFTVLLGTSGTSSSSKYLDRLKSLFFAALSAKPWDNPHEMLGDHKIDRVNPFDDRAESSGCYTHFILRNNCC